MSREVDGDGSVRVRVSGGGDRELAGNQFLRGGASLPAMLVTHLGTFELPN